jgi:hypothetical protein
MILSELKALSEFDNLLLDRVRRKPLVVLAQCLMFAFTQLTVNEDNIEFV